MHHTIESKGIFAVFAFVCAHLSMALGAWVNAAGNLAGMGSERGNTCVVLAVPRSELSAIFG